MPEDLNVEIAGGLAEGGTAREAAEKLRWERFVEICEAIFLAAVAVSTAWSGYQAARWDGRQAERYGTASAIRIQADEQLTAGGEQKLLDVVTFNTWIQAKKEGRDGLAALYVRRFSPEFKTAFDAWIAMHPFSNPDAPPAPTPRPAAPASRRTPPTRRAMRATRRTKRPRPSSRAGPKRVRSQTTTS